MKAEVPIAFLVAAIIAALPIPKSAALTGAIAARDEAVFGLLFKGCDRAAMAGFLSPDFEAYHDKGGVAACTRADFSTDDAKSCEAKKGA